MTFSLCCLYLGSSTTGLESFLCLAQLLNLPFYVQDEHLQKDIAFFFPKLSVSILPLNEITTLIQHYDGVISNLNPKENNDLFEIASKLAHKEFLTLSFLDLLTSPSPNPTFLNKPSFWILSGEGDKEKSLALLSSSYSFLNCGNLSYSYFLKNSSFLKTGVSKKLQLEHSSKKILLYSDTLPFQLPPIWKAISYANKEPLLKTALFALAKAVVVDTKYPLFLKSLNFSIPLLTLKSIDKNFPYASHLAPLCKQWLIAEDISDLVPPNEEKRKFLQEALLGKVLDPLYLNEKLTSSLLAFKEKLYPFSI